MNEQHTIYIAESGNSFYQSLAQLLEREGYVVKGVHSKEILKESFAEDKPACVLLDITDKQIEGFELLEWLHALPNEKPAIIILSLSDEPIEIDRAVSLGADDYIVKVHFTPQEALAKIKRAIMRRYVTMTTTMRHPQPTKGPKSEPVSLGNIRALIVEDDQFLRELSNKKLTKEGFTVELAIDGNDGYKKIVETKPDIVLLDIILPGIDGFEILRKVRQHQDKKVQKTPIILLSNLGQESDVMKGERLGADDYLIKANFTIDEIIDKIKSVLAKKK